MGALVDGFTVREAAEALGVSRIRVQHMIRDGQLVAERAGNRWIIPRHEVFRCQRIPRPGGRPYTAARCWDIIDELCHDHRPLEWLHENWHLLCGRARHTTGRMLPDLIDDVYEDQNVVVGGAHAAADRGAAARPFTPPLDVYLPETKADSYSIGIGLRPVTAEPNITVHTVTSSQWELLSTSRTVNLVVAYADLMEAGDRAAAEVYHELRSGKR
jgi:excisionase family DNA binding protein